MNLEDLSKQRLVELLRSTSEYRQFVFYYDSHELSYLRRMNEQHSKNCDHTISEKEKNFWAPTEILEKLHRFNHKEDLGLSDREIEMIVSKMKFYYEKNLDYQIKKIEK